MKKRGKKIIQAVMNDDRGGRYGEKTGLKSVREN